MRLPWLWKFTTLCPLIYKEGLQKMRWWPMSVAQTNLTCTTNYIYVHPCKKTPASWRGASENEMMAYVSCPDHLTCTTDYFFLCPLLSSCYSPCKKTPASCVVCVTSWVIEAVQFLLISTKKHSCSLGAQSMFYGRPCWSKRHITALLLLCSFLSTKGCVSLTAEPAVLWVGRVFGVTYLFPPPENSENSAANSDHP